MRSQCYYKSGPHGRQCSNQAYAIIGGRPVCHLHDGKGPAVQARREYIAKRAARVNSPIRQMDDAERARRDRS